MSISRLCLLSYMLSSAALSQDASEQAALDLAPPPEGLVTDETTSSAKSFGFGAELAGTYDVWRLENWKDAPPDPLAYRVSTIVAIDKKWSRVRAIFADRIDAGVRLNERITGDAIAHTLKEAYLGVGTNTDFVDVGRFIERIGVAYGYNPTDFTRRNAVVARTSDDPSLLRSDRLGTIGVRAQHLFAQGSFTAVYAPYLRHEPSRGVLPIYAERTNSDDYWLLRASRKLFSGALLVEAEAYRTSVSGVQPGLNLSWLAGDRLIVYGEASLTKEQDVVDRALAVDADAPFLDQGEPREQYRTRAAAGVSVAVTSRFTTVFEAHYDETALTREAWDALANPQTLAELAAYLRVRDYATLRQDNLAKRYLFGRFLFRDAFGKRSSISSFVRYNEVDKSWYAWLRAGIERDVVSIGVTVSRAVGDRATEFGDALSKTTAQLNVGFAF